MARKRKLSHLTLFLFFLLQCQGVLPPNKSQSQNNLILGLLALNTVANQGDCEKGGDLYALNVQTLTSYCVPVELVTTRQKFEVYKQKNISINLDLIAFANQFEDVIYPKVTAAFGEPLSPNPNKKLAILVLDIQDGARPGSSFVAGYFDPTNYFPENSENKQRSNFRDILYLDGKELIESLNRDPQAFSATAAHEFQHLIRFPYMWKVRATDDLWVNEGTSEVASDIAGFGPQKLRIDCFRGADSARCPNGVNNVSMLNWGSTESTTILKQYALSYVYMRYLYDISGNTESERNSFFRKSSQGGTDGLRASFAGNLMRVLSTSPRFDSTLLGNSDPETFFRTFTLLMGQATSVTNFSNVVRYTLCPNCSAQTINLDPAFQAYPLGSTLQGLRDINSAVVTTNTTGSISTGSIRVFSTIRTLADSITQANGFTNIGNMSSPSVKRTLLVWGAYSTAVNNAARSGEPELASGKPDLEVQKKRLQSLTSEINWLSDGQGICGHQFIPTREAVPTAEIPLLE